MPAPSSAPAAAPSTFPASYAALPSTMAPSTSSSTSTPAAPPRNRSRIASARLRPETTVMRALASCSTSVATVEKVSAQRSAYPCAAPADAAVVTVPGPMKAAGMTAQKRMFRRRFMGRRWRERRWETDECARIAPEARHGRLPRRTRVGTLVRPSSR